MGLCSCLQFLLEGSDACAEAQLLQSTLTDAQLEERLQTLSSQARC